VERLCKTLLIGLPHIATAHGSSFRLFSLAVSLIFHKIIAVFAFYSYNLFPCLTPTKSVGSSQT
jgi:hypothetical protein